MSLRNEIDKAQTTDYEISAPRMAVHGALSAGGIYGAFRLSSKIPTNVPVGNLRFLNQQSLTYLDKSGTVINGRPWYEAFGRTSESKASIQELILNAVKATEEQLFKIPRALSGYGILSGHTLRNLSEEGFRLNAEMLAGQKKYLRIISNGKINDQMISQGGLMFKKGQIVTTNEMANTLSGEIINPGHVVLDNASMHFNYWNSAHDANRAKGTPRKGFSPRWNQSLQRHYGLHPHNNDFIITGGQNLLDIKGTGGLVSAYRKLNAALSVGFENSMKLFDDPFEALLSPAENLLGSKAKGFLKKGSKFWNTIGMRNILGVGGWENMKRGGGISKLLSRHALRGLPVLALGAWGISSIDELTHGRIKGTAARVYQDASVLGSRVSDLTGMTAYAKKQKEIAPGSTSVMGLAALPASLAIAGGTMGGIQNLVEKTPVGEKVLPQQFYREAAQYLEERSGAVGKAFKFMNLSKKGRTGSYAIMGAALGAALVLPFLPGALGAEKSAAEKKEIYSGDKKIPVRYGRRWEFGITPYEGEDIKFYEPHWTVKAITDAAKRSKLGKFYGNPIGRVINKAVDPYYLERELDEERPYAYWGPSDSGFGFTEKLLTPIKEIFKPTIVAHSEALGVDHPSRNKRIDKTPPETLSGDLAVSTGNVSTPPVAPNSTKSYAKDTASSFSDMLGLVGFVYGSTIDKATGGQGFLTQDAVYESSGRIMSAQRAYWDAELGGMAGLNEFYRRLNPNRPYGTEYVQAAIKNTQPSWMPEEFQYGDPFSSVQQGEYRMPGTGYGSLHPELKGLDLEDYPAIHRLNILQDVAKTSVEYYKARSDVDKAHTEGRLNKSAERMYENIQQYEQQMRDEESGRFDYGDKGTASAYWLKLKQLGRALPTEHLYPLSPVHKFSGNVDPMTDYKSMVLLDSPFKEWSNPVSDYIKPTFNSVMNIATFGNYVPGRTKKVWETEDYFQKLQYAKNQLLDEQSQKYFEEGDLASSAYIKSGKRTTVYDTSPIAGVDEQASLFNQKQRKYFDAFASSKQGHSQILKSVSPNMGTMLQGQWAKYNMSANGDFEQLEQMQHTVKTMGEGMTANGMIANDEIPGRDFVGYAPGVNLNAFKVKVADNTGMNIRDFNLWKEDERQARLLDALSRSSHPDSPLDNFNIKSRDRQKKELQGTLSSMGMADVELSAIPITGVSRVHFQGTPNNNEGIHKIMREEGYVTY